MLIVGNDAQLFFYTKKIIYAPLHILITYNHSLAFTFVTSFTIIQVNANKIPARFSRYFNNFLQKQKARR
jgi:hypothetical protein